MLAKANKSLKEWYSLDSDLRTKAPQVWVESVNSSLRRMLLGAAVSTVASCFMTFGLWVSQGFNGRGLPNIPLLDPLDFGFNGKWIHELSSFVAVVIMPTVIMVSYKWSKKGRVMLFPAVHALMWAQILLIVLVVCLDVWRMQTWLYIFTTICLVLNVYHPQLLTHRLASAIPSEDLYTAVSLCRVVTCSVWMHSGLLKFNPNYPRGDFSMMVPLFELIPPSLVNPLAYGSALFETCLGLVPLIVMSWSYRTNGACMEQDTLISACLRLAWLLVPVAAAGMHGFIMVRLLYQHYELGVIPWNFAFLTYTYFLFVRIRSPFPVLKPNRSTLVSRHLGRQVTLAAIVLLYVIMPVLAAVNCYHCYLSFSMYTTNDPALLIFTPLNEQLHPIFPRNSRVFEHSSDVFRFRSCGINLEEKVPLYFTHNWDWGFTDTGASLYPSFWSYEQLARKTCEMAPPTHPPIEFVVVEKLAFPYWGTQHYYKRICSEGKLSIVSRTACKE